LRLEPSWGQVYDIVANDTLMVGKQMALQVEEDEWGQEWGDDDSRTKTRI